MYFVRLQKEYTGDIIKCLYSVLCCILSSCPKSRVPQSGVILTGDLHTVTRHGVTQHYSRGIVLI